MGKNSRYNGLQDEHVTSMTMEDVKLYIQEVIGEVRKGVDRK